MKILLKRILFFYLATLLVFISCRTEESEIIETPPEDILTSNALVASLMQKTSINDGSNDNIIDYANCFNVKLPITVTVNGEEIPINSEEDFKIIEYIFDDSDDDVDVLTITFPIQIILNDFSEVIINNYTELASYSINCNGENEADDDIECLNFKYPITAFLYNANDEIIDSIQINSDSNLYNFIKDLDTFDLVSINFPITVALLDGTEFIINNLTELENTIKAYEDYCDEDDDYDYNDDDCNNCNTNELIDFLTNCPGWTVDKLERYGNDYDDAYDGYTFNFLNDGTISVSWSSTTVNGTWTAAGTGNNITVTINIPSLPYCNNDWVLHEISDYSKTKIDLRVGDDDRLRYYNNCN
ncbi:hypothetical protein [Changchengzhania lutea]|uniref:hypothetical protein n=1 Tax=Changchengzhania lutea TaxID=2049305 RepID=UPI00115EB756|nr:hypothetical protein [Changchengzhania lutea]